MYAWLSRRVGPGAAAVATAAWYTLLILLTAYFALAEQVAR